MIAAVGDLVAYEDQANPRTVYRVVAVPHRVLRPTDYCLHEVETEEVIWSDLRQAGWTRVEEEPVGAGIFLIVFPTASSKAVIPLGTRRSLMRN